MDGLLHSSVERLINMKAPSILTVKDVQRYAAVNEMEAFPGHWVPCRPVGNSSRWKAAFLVFTGKADALTWIKQ